MQCDEYELISMMEVQQNVYVMSRVRLPWAQRTPWTSQVHDVRLPCLTWLRFERIAFVEWSKD